MASDPESPSALCPSTTCHEGAKIIAVLGEDGRLGYLRPALLVDERFDRDARREGDPESRFRFADECVQTACEHWSDQHCRLIGQLAGAPSAPKAEAGTADELPRCDIRATCRWFAQSGRSACAVCPVVVYRPSSSSSV